jgi:hypothetical protein
MISKGSLRPQARWSGGARRQAWNQDEKNTFFHCLLPWPEFFLFNLFDDLRPNPVRDFIGSKRRELPIVLEEIRPGPFPSSGDSMNIVRPTAILALAL